jgi:hypothetical protein
MINNIGKKKEKNTRIVEYNQNKARPSLHLNGIYAIQGLKGSDFCVLCSDVPEAGMRVNEKWEWRLGVCELSREAARQTNE